MKKKERKTLETKIHAALIQALKDEKTLLTDKIEKAIKKAVKQLSKKFGKKKKVSAKKKTKRKTAKKTTASSDKKTTSAAPGSKTETLNPKL